jgi:hypothetical protein
MSSPNRISIAASALTAALLLLPAMAQAAPLVGSHAIVRTTFNANRAELKSSIPLMHRGCQ